MLFDPEELPVRTVRQKPDVHRVIQRYHDRFTEKFGFAPRIAHGKDAKLLKDNVGAWGVDVVLELVDRFFETSNPRVTRSDYSVGAFHALAQGLLIEVRRGRVDETTAAIVDAVRRASEEA